MTVDEPRIQGHAIIRFWVSQKLYKTEIQLHWTITRGLLSRRLRQRERLHASVLSICSFVCLYVCLSVCRQNAKNARFSQKQSNLEVWCLLTTYRKSYLGLSKNPLLDHKIQDGADLPSWMLTPRCKTRFSGKLSNLEPWCLLSIYRKLCNWAFPRTHYWIPKIPNGWDPPSWK